MTARPVRTLCARRPIPGQGRGAADEDQGHDPRGVAQADPRVPPLRRRPRLRLHRQQLRGAGPLLERLDPGTHPRGESPSVGNGLRGVLFQAIGDDARECVVARRRRGDLR